MMHNTKEISSLDFHHPLSTRPTKQTNPPLQSTVTNNCSRRQCLVQSNSLRLGLIQWPRFDYQHLWLLFIMFAIGGHLVTANAVSPIDDHRSILNTTSTTAPNPTTSPSPPIAALHVNQPLGMASDTAASTHWIDSSISNQVVGAVQLKSVQQANQQQKPPPSSGDEDDYYFDKDDDLDEYELLIANKTGEFQTNINHHLACY